MAKIDSNGAALAKLSPAELAALVANGANPWKLAMAAHTLGEQKQLDATLRIFDALLEVPLHDLGLMPACNGTYWLTVANEQANGIEHGIEHEIDKARNRKYLERWGPVAKKFTMLYVNLANLDIALGRPQRAVAWLREAVLQGDHQIAEQLRDKSKPDQFAPLRKLPAFRALLKLEPLVPPALRGLHATMYLHLDEHVVEAAKDCDLNEIMDSFEEEVGDAEMHRGHMYSLGAKGKRLFKPFGLVTGNSDVAFWERTPGQPLAKQPIVLFGSRGNVSVCAKDFDGFLTLLGHRCSLRELGDAGFHYKDAEWTPPKPRELGKLKPNKRMLAALAKWAPQITKRKPDAERQAALALVPELLTVFRKLCKVRD